MSLLLLLDQGAWIAVRIIGLMQAIIGETISIFYQPNPCRSEEYEDFNKLYSMIFGGWMLFHSHKPDDLPSAISERMLNVGRFVLGLVSILTITNVLQVVL